MGLHFKFSILFYEMVCPSFYSDQGGVGVIKGGGDCGLSLIIYLVTEL